MLARAHGLDGRDRVREEALCGVASVRCHSSPSWCPRFLTVRYTVHGRAVPSSTSLLDPARLLQQQVMSNLLGAEDEILSLNNIRNVLIRLEDTIIFCACVRARDLPCIHSVYLMRSTTSPR